MSSETTFVVLERNLRSGPDVIASWMFARGQVAKFLHRDTVSIRLNESSSTSPRNQRGESTHPLGVLARRREPGRRYSDVLTKCLIAN